jgi:hypothetical protein
VVWLELHGHPIAFILGEVLHRHTLRQVLLEQSVEVLVLASFPCVVGVREVSGDRARCLDLLVIV